MEHAQFVLARVVLVLACLACPGHGRRVQAADIRVHKTSLARRQHPLTVRSLLQPARVDGTANLTLAQGSGRPRRAGRRKESLARLLREICGSVAFNPSGPLVLHQHDLRRICTPAAQMSDALSGGSVINSTSEISGLTKQELQARLKAMGKPAGGKRAALIERLEEELGIRPKPAWKLEKEAKRAEWEANKEKYLAMKKDKAPVKEPIITNEACNVVLTHVNADFDSLAGAVALSKLWSIERPEYPTFVVMPMGANPLVLNFLMLHKHLLPVRGFGTIRAEDVRAVGIVDTQSPSRLGKAAAWLEIAEWVEIYDHHDVQGHDHNREDCMKCNKRNLEPVGSATTMIVEKLQKAMEEQSPPQKLSDAQATLFSLGIRADTGTLLFPGTTQRDGRALVYLMGQGASQAAIAEFGQARLTEIQRQFLAEAMGNIELTMHEGLKTGIVQLEVNTSGNLHRSASTGMALVAEELLQLMSIDVLVLGVLSRAKKGRGSKDQMALIGRCSARASSVDLNVIMSRWKGGGHPAAASARLKFNSSDEVREQARGVLKDALHDVLSQIPKQPTAGEMMIKDLVTCTPDDTMSMVAGMMKQASTKVLFVLDHEHKPVGVIKYPRVVKAERAGKGNQSVKAWMQRQIPMVQQDATLADIESVLADGSTGNLPVVNQQNFFLGLVTRNEVLDQQKLYDVANSKGHDGSVLWEKSPSNVPEHASASGEASTNSTLQGEACNVVLTHTSADFDSLAGAVSLAKIWSIERPDYPTYVVMPQGVHPRVARFQMYNKHLFPVRGFSTIRAEDVRAVGVVDTQFLHRLGPAASWLDNATWVEVFDHFDPQRSLREGLDDHQMIGDIECHDRHVEPIGSVTTLLTERLHDLIARRSLPLKLSKAEATLFALGIREATGALSYKGTTVRDGRALIGLMESASQVAIAEFGHDRLSATQRDLFKKAMQCIRLQMYEGIKIGIVQLHSPEFVTGMAVVAEELLHLYARDVLVLGVTHRDRRGQSALSLIGRCSARGSIVSLNNIFVRWGGGGHPAAAAASLRFGADCKEQAQAAVVLQEVLTSVKERIPMQPSTRDIMNRTVVACLANSTIDQVMKRMNEASKKVILVHDDQHILLGMIKYPQVVKASRQRKGSSSVQQWMTRQILTIGEDLPMAKIEAILADGKSGHLPVVNNDNKLLGIVTRGDLLKQLKIYGSPDTDGQVEHSGQVLYLS